MLSDFVSLVAKPKSEAHEPGGDEPLANCRDKQEAEELGAIRRQNENDLVERAMRRRNDLVAVLGFSDSSTMAGNESAESGGNFREAIQNVPSSEIVTASLPFHPLEASCTQTMALLEITDTTIYKQLLIEVHNQGEVLDEPIYSEWGLQELTQVFDGRALPVSNDGHAVGTAFAQTQRAESDIDVREICGKQQVSDIGEVTGPREQPSVREDKMKVETVNAAASNLWRYRRVGEVGREKRAKGGAIDAIDQSPLPLYTDSPPSLPPPKPPSLSTPRAGARVQSSGSGLKSAFERPPTAAQIEVSSHAYRND